MLRMLVEDDVPLLKTFLRGKMPVSINVLSVLKMEEEFKIKKKIWVNSTDPTLFIFIQDIEPWIPSFMMYWDTERLKLEDVEQHLESVPDWKWGRPFLTSSVHSTFQEKLQNIFFEGKLSTRSIKNVETYDCTMYALEAKELQQYKLPKGFQFGELRPHHASLIYTHWKFSANHDDTELAKHLEILPSTAVYKDGEDESLNPVSWILLYPHGHIGMLHTLPEYRKLGIGKAVVGNISQKIKGQLDFVIAEAESDNSVSIALLQKSGFRSIASSSWSIYHF